MKMKICLVQKKNLMLLQSNKIRILCENLNFKEPYNKVICKL